MKHPLCSPCVLFSRNPSFVPPDGPLDAPLLVVGEAAGREEAKEGRGFVGPSGQFLFRQARRAGFSREQCRVTNVAWCMPGQDATGHDLPPPPEAVAHCRVHTAPVLSEPHQAILTLGVPATREVLRHFGHAYDPAPDPQTGKRKQNSIANWRGYVVGDGSHPWIIPSLHPAFVSDGNRRYTGVLIHDLRKAWEVATQGFTRSEVSLVADPPLDWFIKWCEPITEDTWLAVDIETPESGDDPDDPSDPSWTILYVNLSYSEGEGISVPFSGPYIPVLRRILETCRWQWYWFAHFDVKRLQRAGIRIPWYFDAMDAWHVLQSDMGPADKGPDAKGKAGTVRGNGLGFVAPLYSDLPPWKHYPTLSPYYRCMDGVQTLRVAYGLARDLQKHGQWETFLRHLNLLDHSVLRPAEVEGLRVDRAKLTAFGQVLESRIATLEEEIQAAVPPEVLPTHPPLGKGWKRPPEGIGPFQEGELPRDGSLACLTPPDAPGALLGRLEAIPVKVCGACRATQVPSSHNCTGVAGQKPPLELEEVWVPRWYRREPFNPSSPDQIRTLLEHRGLKTSKAKKAKTDRMSTEASQLEKLASREPVLARVMDLREVEKTKGTYCDGVQKRLDEAERVHTTFLHRPSTMRPSSTNPNLFNVTRGDEEEESHPWDASGFRQCIVAGDGCILVELDFSAIEALITGWCCGDPQYIRLGKAGIHAYLTAYAVDPNGVPKPDSVSTEELKKLLRPFKSHKLYPIKKKTVHRVNYGSTALGMHKDNPEIYPSTKAAQAELDFYASLCPKVFPWQNAVRDLAHTQGYLGGNGVGGRVDGMAILGHPYRYRHWFFDVKSWSSRYNRWGPGSDSNRVVAFYPQSIAWGVLVEAVLSMTDPESLHYIGDLYFGKTPIRATIYDSVFCEVPVEAQEKLIERASAAMLRPVQALPCPPEWGMGEYLTIGVEVKRGRNWAPRTESNTEGMESISL